MKKIIFLTASLFVATLTLSAQSSDYSKKLNEMFVVSGSEESYKAAITQMLTIFKQQSPETGEDTWKELEVEFMKSSISDLTEMLVPVYQKYLTLEDLEGMIAFYKTPVGQKYARTTPLIMQESMQIGAEWGQKIGENLQKKLEEKSK